jgi:hypothetical protein
VQADLARSVRRLLKNGRARKIPSTPQSYPIRFWMTQQVADGFFAPALISFSVRDLFKDYRKPIDDLAEACVFHDICCFNCRSAVHCDKGARVPGGGTYCGLVEIESTLFEVLPTLRVYRRGCYGLTSSSLCGGTRTRVFGALRTSADPFPSQRVQKVPEFLLTGPLLADRPPSQHGCKRTEQSPYCCVQAVAAAVFSRLEVCFRSERGSGRLNRSVRSPVEAAAHSSPASTGRDGAPPRQTDRSRPVCGQNCWRQGCNSKSHLSLLYWMSR